MKRNRNSKRRQRRLRRPMPVTGTGFGSTPSEPPAGPRDGDGETEPFEIPEFPCVEGIPSPQVPDIFRVPREGEEDEYDEYYDGYDDEYDDVDDDEDEDGEHAPPPPEPVRMPAPTHPDHGPMDEIPRNEDGRISAYYYCSKAELEMFGIDSPPPRRGRRDGFGAERQAQFIEHYRDTGSLSEAARRTGISRTTAYNLISRADAAPFRAALEEAGRGLEILLETCALDRAINGQEEVVYYKGERVGSRVRYDNRLLMAMLRARNPLKYAPLSEIEGWLRRRGPEPAPDLPASLDRLAAAEAEWGRTLPDEAPAPLPPLPRRERPGLAAKRREGEGTPAEIAQTLSNLSTSPETGHSAPAHPDPASGDAETRGRGIAPQPAGGCGT